LLAATMARGNRQEEVPVFSASGTVGMLSPCTALCTYFSTAFFLVSSWLLSVIGDRGIGLTDRVFFSFNFVMSRILAIVFSAKTRAKLITPTYN